MRTSKSAAGELTCTDVSETRARRLTRSERLGGPEKRMRDGRRLVLAGFVIAVLGIVAYCFVGLSAPATEQVVSGPADMIGPALGVIGIGTLLWLVGSFVFLRGAMDSDPDGPDINF